VIAFGIVTLGLAMLRKVTLQGVIAFGMVTLGLVTLRKITL
jgi:hypothetical protein